MFIFAAQFYQMHKKLANKKAIKLEIFRFWGLSSLSHFLPFF